MMALLLWTTLRAVAPLIVLSPLAAGLARQVPTSLDLVWRHAISNWGR